MPEIASHKIIGLMSGTSADGVDAALVEIHGVLPEITWRLLAFETYPYPTSLKERVLRACRPETSDVRLICALNFELGRQFAEAVTRLLVASGHTQDQIELIGSHGQTIYHQPPSAEAGEPSTLQIGEAAVIAQETGISTVSDFRVADVAAGGEGAPLVPYVDFLLFRKPGKIRALQNIGGISNVTYLPEHLNEVRAFDTGPGNMLIDGAMQYFTGQPMDHDGAFAAEGMVHPKLLARLMAHPFLTQSPPKSTGREAFGTTFLDEVLQFAHEQALSPSETVTTLTAFTAHSIHASYGRFLQPPPEEILLSGGGRHNRTLCQMLVQLFAPIPVCDIADQGNFGDAKEAVAFAILAHAMMARQPANLPRVTGASRPVVLGKYVPAGNSSS